MAKKTAAELRVSDIVRLVDRATVVKQPLRYGDANFFDIIRIDLIFVNNLARVSITP